VKSSASVSATAAKRVRALHRHFVFNADRNDVARRHDHEVHLIVGPHHAEGLLDAQVKRAAHASGNIPTEGTQATHQ
jgi:hypothetical protein